MKQHLKRKHDVIFVALGKEADTDRNTDIEEEESYIDIIEQSDKVYIFSVIAL